MFPSLDAYKNRQTNSPSLLSLNEGTTALLQNNGRKRPTLYVPGPLYRQHPAEQLGAIGTEIVQIAYLFLTEIAHIRCEES